MKRFSVKPKLGYSRRILIGHAEDADEYIYLGRLAEAGSVVRVDFDISEPHVVGIFGKRGSGKSYSLGSFLEGLCAIPADSSIANNQHETATLLLDTLGIFQWMGIPLDASSDQQLVRQQSELLRGWDIKPELLNVTVWAPKGYAATSRVRELTVDCADFTPSDLGYLLGVDIFQDRTGQLLNDVFQRVTAEGWSNGKRHFKAQPTYAIEDLTYCIETDPEIAQSYHSETRRSLIQQLSVYSRNPLFQPKRGVQSIAQEMGSTDNCSPERGTGITDLLQKGHLSIVLLNKVSDELRWVLIVSIIRKIMAARTETAELEKSLKVIPHLSAAEQIAMATKIAGGVPPTWIVADEAQNFLPSERSTGATDILIRLVREGRNSGLSFMFTTQQPTSIDARILAQVDTLICHKLTVQTDLDYVRRNLKSALPEEVKFGSSVLSFDDWLRSLDTGQAIISNTESDRTYVVDIRPRVSVHGGFGR